MGPHPRPRGARAVDDDAGVPARQAGTRPRLRRPDAGSRWLRRRARRAVAGRRTVPAQRLRLVPPGVTAGGRGAGRVGGAAPRRTGRRVRQTALPVDHSARQARAAERRREGQGGHGAAGAVGGAPVGSRHRRGAADDHGEAVAFGVSGRVRAPRGEQGLRGHRPLRPGRQVPAGGEVAPGQTRGGAAGRDPGPAAELGDVDRHNRGARRVGSLRGPSPNRPDPSDPRPLQSARTAAARRPALPGDLGCGHRRLHHPAAAAGPGLVLHRPHRRNRTAFHIAWTTHLAG